MSKRQIGLSEAIYRALPNMHLHQSNIGTIFVQSGYPENQSRFLRKIVEHVQRVLKLRAKILGHAQRLLKLCSHFCFSCKARKKRGRTQPH